MFFRPDGGSGRRSHGSGLVSTRWRSRFYRKTAPSRSHTSDVDGALCDSAEALPMFPDAHQDHSCSSKLNCTSAQEERGNRMGLDFNERRDRGE